MQYDEEKYSSSPWLLPKASENQRLNRDDGSHGAEGRPVSVTPGQTQRGGIYNTPSQPNESLKDSKKQKDPFHIHFLNMAEIVIATRQAVSLNRFSANTKQGNTGAAPDFSAAESLNMSRINFSCNYIPTVTSGTGIN